MNSSLTQLDQIKGTLIDLAIRFGPKLLAAILIMTAGAFAAGWAGAHDRARVVGEILHNYGRIRQCEVSVGVAYDADLAGTLSVIRGLVQSNPRVLADPAPLVQIGALADSAVQISIKPWVAVADYGAAAGELNLSIVEELRRRDISIPFPRHEVRLLNAA